MSDAAEKAGKYLREQQAIEARIDELAAAAEAGADTEALERELGLDADRVRSAYAPLPAQTEAALLDAVLRSLGTPSAAPEQADVAQSEPRDAATREPRALRSRRLWYLAPLLAAAAVVTLWFASSSSSNPGALASYQLEVVDGVAVRRGPEQGGGTTREPLRLRPGSELRLLLRPEQDVEGDVIAKVYLRYQASTSELASAVDKAASGTLRLRVALGAELPEAGRLIVWVGRAELAGSAASRDAAEEEGKGLGWQRFVRSFSHAEAPPPSEPLRVPPALH